MSFEWKFSKIKYDSKDVRVNKDQKVANTQNFSTFDTQKKLIIKEIMEWVKGYKSRKLEIGKSCKTLIS